MPLSIDNLRDALEAVVKAELIVDRVHDQERRIEEVVAYGLNCDEAEAAIEDACQAAVHEENVARERLAEMLADQLGPAPWVALIAGHLICLCDRADSMTVMPIEKVHHLDNLRSLTNAAR